MKHRRTPIPAHTRRGFALVEMVVACLLMALLASTLAVTWAAFGRPLVEAQARCRLVREARLAAEAIAEDLGGEWDPDTLDGRFRLEYSGASDGTPTVTYLLDDSPNVGEEYTIDADDDDDRNALLRVVGDPPTSVRVVAREVAGFGAEADADLANRVNVWLTFRWRTIEKTYRLAIDRTIP